MKTFAVLLSSVLLVIGLVGGALAQSDAPAPGSGSTTSNPETRPDNPTDRNSSVERRDQTRVTTPGSDVKVDIQSERRDESPATSPRTGESSRIFGLSPTAFMLIVAGLFIVVILALVSMTRGGSRPDTHIDLDRR
jgi:preprotein translocase subunit SecG